MVQIFEQITLIIISILSISFGFWVYLQAKKEKTNQWFTITALCILGWVNFAYFGANSSQASEALFWYRLNLGIVSLFIFSAYLFVCYYTTKKIKILEKIFLTGLVVLSLLSFFTKLIIKETIIKEWGAEIIFGELGVFYKVFIFFIALALLKNLFYYHFSVNQKEKLKIQYFIIGAILFVLGNIIFNIIFPIIFETVRYQHFGDFSAIFFLAFTAYAIVKRELFDIKIVLTALLVGLIAILLFLDALIFTEEPSLQIVKTIIFIIFLFFGRYLIKSVQLEIKRRQELENLTFQLGATNTKLKLAYEKLERLDKAKSEFISIASHQLRTPLSAIKGYLSMILEESYGKYSKKMEKPLENVYTSNERLTKLVNDLLSISRIEAGKIELEPEQASIEKITSEVINELKIVADKKKIYLRLEKPKQILPKILVDKDKLRQVILNIIDNAIRYTVKGGISIKFKAEKTVFRIIISDTGEGMSAEEISKLFETFSRGKAGNRLWTEGAGLGLYIAKKFIEMHKGKIWAESKGKNKGSVFYIELPI